MDEEMAVRAIIAVFAVLMGLSYIYPGASFVVYLVAIIAFMAVLWVIKGIIDMVRGGTDVSLYAGVAIILILILFFNGFSFVADTIHFIGTIVLTALSVLGAAAMALFP